MGTESEQDRLNNLLDRLTTLTTEEEMEVDRLLREEAIRSGIVPSDYISES